MKFLVDLITAILAKVVPAWIKKSKQSMDKGAKPGTQEGKIKEKLKKDGWIVVFFAIFLFCSCATRVVYIEPGKSVRLRETVKNVKVWVKTDQGEVLPGVADLKEGGFYIPHIDQEDTD